MRSEGTTAIEFAVVAPLFLAIVFGIFFVGWDHYTIANLDSAVLSLSRKLSENPNRVIDVKTTRQLFCEGALQPQACSPTSLVLQIGPPGSPRFSNPALSFVNIQRGGINVISVSSKFSMTSRFTDSQKPLGAVFAVYIP